MNRPRVLFVCLRNAARSQMAEALLRERCGDRFEVHSAGLEAGELDPAAVEAMREVGLDISQARAKRLWDYTLTADPFRHVISVCDEAGGEKPPVFPYATNRLSWSFPDPATFQGGPQERLTQMRGVRNAIAARIEEWCEKVCAGAA